MKRLNLIVVALLGLLVPAHAIAQDGELIEEHGGVSISASRYVVNYDYEESHPSYSFDIDVFPDENDAIVQYESYESIAEPDQDSTGATEEAVDVPEVADDAVGKRRTSEDGDYFSVDFFFRIGTDVYWFSASNSDVDPYEAMYELVETFFTGEGSEVGEETPDFLAGILAKLPNLGDLPDGYEIMSESVTFERI